MNGQKRDLEKLCDMLSYRRPAFSHTEHLFSKRFIAPTGAVQDEAGNWTLQIGSSPRTLWSSHTDTVHQHQHRQSVVVDGDFIKLPARGSKKSTCLGADCTAGVWIMLEMIAAGVPGLYVFHSAEEIGSQGAHYLASIPGYFTGIDFAIAFDRMGYNSIVTHQGSGNSASSEFATQLGKQLELGMMPDPTGMWTDTAVYWALIPECTNISVGYSRAHSKKETLNWRFLFELRDAMLKYDEEQLVAVRKAGYEEPEPWLLYLEDHSKERDANTLKEKKPEEDKAIFHPLLNAPSATALLQYEGYRDEEDFWLSRGM